MVKAILWDNDGVLVDTEELYFRATRELLSTVGIELTRDLFIRISLKQGQSAFDLAAEQGVTPEVVDRLQEKRNRRYSELLKKGVRVPTGVEDTLRKLFGKVSMGVVTSCRREHFKIIHASTGLLRYFDFVLTREDYGHSKPDPEPFLTAVAQNRLEPEQCLVVEDSERGLKAARAAGIRCLVIPNDLTRGGDFSGAYRVLSSVREVAAEVLGCLDDAQGNDFNRQKQK